MKSIKIVAIFGLITGLAGLSHAGFKDALKSAGGALNEVTGTALVRRDVSVQDSSSCSAEDFKKEHQFSDEEYRQWLQDVIRQLKSAGWKPVPGVSVDGMVADGKRAKISEDEAKKVFCTVENSGIFFAQDFAYFSAGDSFVKFNYATLAAGHCDERGDVLSNSESSRVISVIEKACDSARSKIDDEKQVKVAAVKAAEFEQAQIVVREKAEKERLDKLAERAAAKAAAEKREQDAEKERADKLQALKNSRSGLVAYEPNGIQWGDSEAVLEKLCGVSGDSFHDKEGRLVELLADPEIGVYSLRIVFFSRWGHKTAGVG